MKFKTLATAVCVAASAFALPAMAAVQTYVIDGFNETNTNFVQVLNLHQFNSALGTLTGISISYSTDVTGQVLLSNSKAAAKDVNLSLTSSAQWTLPGDVLGATSHALLTGTVSAKAKTTDVLAAKHTETLTINTAVDSSLFALFLGSGQLSSQLLVKAISATSSPTGITADYSTLGKSLGGTITYTYAPAVPEPETYGMMLLGLGVLAYAGKRKARSAQV